MAATALAMAEARRGRKTLLAEMQGRDKVAALLGAPPVGAKMREVFEHFYVIDMDLAEALREYALIMFRFEAVYNAVFENRLVRRFLRLIPSLRELVMLGKVWYHEQERVDGRPRFDVIVLDAPSTGHALTMLKAPAVVERTVPPGPLRNITRDLQTLLTDKQRTVLHVVTTPEEMPINEAIEIEQAATNIIRIGLGATIINQRLEPLPDNALVSVAANAPPEIEPLIETLGVRCSKRRAGEALLKRLPAYMLEHSVDFPRIVTRTFGREIVETFADRLRSIVEKET